MTTVTKDDIRPEAVMTEDGLRQWEALPPAEQLERLRAAIKSGIASGQSASSMDDIWSRLEARLANAKL